MRVDKIKRYRMLHADESEYNLNAIVSANNNIYKETYCITSCNTNISVKVLSIIKNSFWPQNPRFSGTLTSGCKHYWIP